MLNSLSNFFRRDSHFERCLKGCSILNNDVTINIHDIRDMLLGLNSYNYQRVSRYRKYDHVE